MKRVLALLLTLVMVMSLSVCAFAADGRDIPEEDRDLEPIPMPKDVSIINDEEEKVLLDALVELPKLLKVSARKDIKEVTERGYKIHSGFGVWTEAEDKTFCAIKLSVKDVPDGAVIFLNAQPIQPETRDNDGYYYFDAPLNTVPDESIILIAVREKKDYIPVPVAEDSGSGPYYPSPTYVRP